MVVVCELGEKAARQQNTLQITSKSTISVGIFSDPWEIFHPCMYTVATTWYILTNSCSFPTQTSLCAKA